MIICRYINNLLFDWICLLTLVIHLYVYIFCLYFSYSHLLFSLPKCISFRVRVYQTECSWEKPKEIIHTTKFRRIMNFSNVILTRDIWAFNGKVLMFIKYCIYSIVKILMTNIWINFCQNRHSRMHNIHIYIERNEEVLRDVLWNELSKLMENEANNLWAHKQSPARKKK